MIIYMPLITLLRKSKPSSFFVLPGHIIRTNLGVLLDFTTDDPDRFVETMALTSPGISLEMQNGSTFHVRSTLYRLPRIGFFATDIFGARVNATQARDYVSVTIPLGSAFEAGDFGHREVYEPGSAFFLEWDKQLGFLSLERTPVHVFNIERALFLEHRGQCRDDGDTTPVTSARLDLKTPEGAAFLRYTNFLWGELRLGNPFLNSPHAVAQIENCVVTLLALTVDRATVSSVKRDREVGYPAYLKRAEDYLEAHVSEPVSLAELAVTAGVSVRTLNRAFKKRFGMGPVGLMKRRRLEHARRTLLAARPTTTTVTQTALGLGFAHMSQFAADYRKLFGELPSETLRR